MKLDIKKVENISKALSDPYRIKIMEAIKKEQTWLQCSSIVDMFGLAQSTISHHLKQLADADLVIVEKDGRATRYIINKEVIDGYVAYLKNLK